MPRTFAIGDIHGALKALEQVIAAIDVQPDDRLIFLGDYVDGWSQSAEVIEYLRVFGKKHHCIFLRGNHDTWCASWLKGDLPDFEWLFHGGKSTIKSYDAVPPKQRTQHAVFFNRLRNYYIDEQDRLFVHAGFSSVQGPAKEPYESNFYWDRSLWENALAAKKKSVKKYPKQLSLFKEIYIGHTPTVNYDVFTPMQACNVWNVDTGAAFDGKLTAINVDTKEFLQSDTVQQLYPNEKGRN
jgi:serine/threonine protein phosphatase 1